MRTNIDIDDELMRETLEVTGIKTKREAVEEGLRLLVRMRRQESLRDLRGIGWEGDLDDMRRDKDRSDNRIVNGLKANMYIVDLAILEQGSLRGSVDFGENTPVTDADR